ncbi:MAG TPA: CHAD domain-containing protein [Mucilaginibacter sp.]|nr:CHAD domain-containing protein [Mucilaginibacter sp.]
MKKKTEKAYFDEQWEGMTTHLKAFIRKGDQVELHQFRVQVKKLRAMLTLLDAASPKQRLLKDFKPVREIFKHCGNIRNAYINLQLSVRYHITNEDFLMGQLSKIENETTKFKNKGRKYLKAIKATHKVIRDDLRAINNTWINEFYKTRLGQISDAFGHLQFNEELHNCRKQIKTLAYNRKIAQPALDGKLQLNDDYLDKLQDSIGNWHDNNLAIELLSTTGVTEKPVITRIKRQNTRLKRSITNLSRDFRKKAILTDKV